MYEKVCKKFLFATREMQKIYEKAARKGGKETLLTLQNIENGFYLTLKKDISAKSVM
jgi:hypothetical protein